MNRRRRCLRPALALALALVALPCIAQAQARADVSASPLSQTPYRIGERLSYNVSFSHFSTAAHVEMLVAGRGTYFGRAGIELRAHVETTGVVSAALLALNNNYNSFVDPTTGVPYRVRQVLREGARASDFGALVGAPAPVTVPAWQEHTPAPGTFDLLSAIYRARALPLAPGAAFTLTVEHQSVPYQVELRVVGRELLKTNVGSSNTLVTQVRVPGNKVLNDYRIQIYFTDDEYRTPALITARHRAGEIRAELTSVEMISEIPPAIGTDKAGPLPTPTPTSGPAPPTTPTPGPAISSGGLPPDLPFKVGEQLNFNFYAGTSPQPIGTASFHVRQRARYFEQDGLLLTAQFQTTGAGQRLFPVNDQISSYVHTSSLLPFRTELKLQEGPRRANWNVSVSQDRAHALFDDGTRVDIPFGTHDLLSVFYALRSFDLTPGKQNRVSLLVNKRPRLLSVTAIQRGEITLGGQRIPAVELSLATNDPQGDRFSLRLWVSTDKRRLPLRLTAQTPIGPIRADLAIIPTRLQ